MLILNHLCRVRGYVSESVANESLFSGGPSAEGPKSAVNCYEIHRFITLRTKYEKCKERFICYNDISNMFTSGIVGPLIKP